MIRPLALGAIALALPAAALAQNLPERRAPYVNDYADLIAPADETTLSLRLAGLHFGDGVEMSVLTLTSRAALGYDASMEELATATFDAWNLGKTTGDDGILVLILSDDEQMRIELGESYGTAYNATASDVLETAFVPGFIDGHPGEAIMSGSEAVIERIALADAPDVANEPEPVPETPPATAPLNTDPARRVTGGN